MRRFILHPVILCGALLLAPELTSAESAVDARDVMEHNFVASKVSAFNGNVSIVLTTAAGQERVRKLKMWSRLKGKSTDSEVMLRFEQPGDIKGTGFLQIENAAADDDIWVYLPALGKTRRLVANAKRDSFFGTDFSYGDVLLPPVNKYDHSYLRREQFDGASCDVIESKPKDGKTRDEIGYSRKVIWLDATNHVERKVEYYDLSGNLLKTQHVFDIQQVESSPQRWIPKRREMLNHQTGHKTLYQMDSITLDRELNDEFFSTRNLER
jgi:outer membrane lipoprotein-sorting protein